MQLVTSARYAILCHMYASYYASLCDVLPCILGNSGQEYPPTRARTWDSYDNLCHNMHDNLAYFGIFSHILVPAALTWGNMVYWGIICNIMPCRHGMHSQRAHTRGQYGIICHVYCCGRCPRIRSEVIWVFSHFMAYFSIFSHRAQFLDPNPMLIWYIMP